ncbi:unnamed protein product [Amoebophrya sp. A120]|nr:unnamed protein product [Amoebophrya sp. A120]|eukprot:GSA120T00006413001.1
MDKIRNDAPTCLPHQNGHAIEECEPLLEATQLQLRASASSRREGRGTNQPTLDQTAPVSAAGREYYGGALPRARGTSSSSYATRRPPKFTLLRRGTTGGRSSCATKSRAAVLEHYTYKLPAGINREEQPDHDVARRGERRAAPAVPDYIGSIARRPSSTITRPESVVVPLKQDKCEWRRNYMDHNHNGFAFAGAGGRDKKYCDAADEQACSKNSGSSPSSCRSSAAEQEYGLSGSSSCISSSSTSPHGASTSTSSSTASPRFLVSRTDKEKNASVDADEGRGIHRSLLTHHPRRGTKASGTTPTSPEDEAAKTQRGNNCSREQQSSSCSRSASTTSSRNSCRKKTSPARARRRKRRTVGTRGRARSSLSGEQAGSKVSAREKSHKNLKSSATASETDAGVLDHVDYSTRNSTNKCIEVITLKRPPKKRVFLFSALFVVLTVILAIAFHIEWAPPTVAPPANGAGVVLLAPAGATVALGNHGDKLYSRGAKSEGVPRPATERSTKFIAANPRSGRRAGGKDETNRTASLHHSTPPKIGAQAGRRNAGRDRTGATGTLRWSSAARELDGVVRPRVGPLVQEFLHDDPPSLEQAELDRRWRIARQVLVDAPAREEQRFAQVLAAAARTNAQIGRPRGAATAQASLSAGAVPRPAPRAGPT